MSTHQLPAVAGATGSPPNGPVLDVAGLSVAYRTGKGQVHAVTDASFEVARGEMLAIIGETGSGKSTVIRALLRLLPPDATVLAERATLHTDERDVSLTDADHRRLRALRGSYIGFVPQSTRGALNPVLTIWQHFASTYRAHRVRGDLRRMAAETLASIGFDDPRRVLAQYPHQLSGGMAQRAVLALAICLDPVLLVADEPTSGLDASIKGQVMRLLRQQATESRRALLMVTHDIAVTAEYCDRVIVMYGGCVVESGPTRKVLGEPHHPYTRALLDAIPRPGRPPRSLPGAAGPVTEPLSRCAFYERCPQQSPQCAAQRPSLREVGGGHRVATFCS